MTHRARSLLPDRAAWLFLGAIFILAGGVLLAMGRPPICACGTVKLWHGIVQSPENSQHVSDWYSFSHVIHGFLFHGAAWLLWRRWRVPGGSPARFALPIAAVVEAGWEILENSPVIIDRYRAVTVSWGYVGDSIVNSLADIGWMVAGFLIAARLPWRITLLVGIVFELFTAWMIRDNLTLNVLMLVYPLDAVRQWQAGG